MQKEILESLRNILKEELQPIKEGIKVISARLERVEDRLEKVEDRLEKVEDRLEKVESKTGANTLLLEDANKKLQILAEVQSSFQEQLGRAKDREGRSLTDRLEVIELAVKDTSQGVKDIQRDLVRVVRATGENWTEIMELKSKSIV